MRVGHKCEPISPSNVKHPTTPNENILGSKHPSGTGIAADANANSRASTATQKPLFHTDFLGRSADSCECKLAHLIPASPQFAAILSDVAELALALPSN
jgi:hypothetical protein